MSNVNPASRIIPTSSCTRTETRLPAARSLVVVIIVVVPVVVIVIVVPVVVIVPIVVIPVVIIVLFNDHRGRGVDGRTRGGVRRGGGGGLTRWRGRRRGGE